MLFPRVDTFKLSTDPRFEDKLVDVVGLYLDPPERAVVLCVDEKPQTQALDRTQPSLPLKPGRARTMTHDYKRHGTTTIFAALDTATGQVLQLCKPRRRHQEFLSFLKWIDLHTPKDLDVHLVLDNLNTHSHPKVVEWLEHPEAARPVPRPLRPLQLVVAEPGRAVVQRDHRQTHPPRQLHLRGRPHRRHRRLVNPLERQPPTLRLDQDRRRDHHQGPPRPSRPRQRHQIRDGPLVS